MSNAVEIPIIEVEVFLKTLTVHQHLHVILRNDKHLQSLQLHSHIFIIHQLMHIHVCLIIIHKALHLQEVDAIATHGFHVEITNGEVREVIASHLENQLVLVDAIMLVCYHKHVIHILVNLKHSICIRRVCQSHSHASAPNATRTHSAAGKNPSFLQAFHV